MNGLPVLSHQVDGRGEPLLLLNGGMMSFSAWDEFVPALAGRHRVLRCDFRGQLRSPGVPPAGFPGHAQDLLRLLDHLGVGRCHVAGTSYGAFAALHLAALAPERVASLVAMTVADRVSGEMWAEAREMVVACREALSGGSRERVYDLISAFAFSTEWAARHETEISARRGLVAHLPDAWFEGLAGLLAALEGLDVSPLAARVSCPALVLLAEEDRAMPRAGGEALARSLARGELAVVPGSGHALVVEKPRETLDILLSFLARHPLPDEAPAPESERDGGTS
ncbi:MAG: alpha/beta fold hydrolase [Holophagales bacterium]|nr:alpha/beta fold hydrolase [Holophagales bacterium]MBK9965931.1 alpha/beta fold hydrolase [Holophagales bacterium]